MHDGNHGITGHTHEELDEKYGHQDAPHHHDYGSTGEQLAKATSGTIRLVAGIVVAVLIAVFVVYKFF